MSEVMDPHEIKTAYTIYIASMRYSEMSGGIRSLYLLCDQLNRRGFQAFTVGGGGAPAELLSPEAVSGALKRDLAAGRAVAIYPDLVAGNPWGTPHVVRLLLNKPGVAGPDTSAKFGEHDYFVTFDRSHVPAGRKSLDLYMPLVNRRYYYPPRESLGRHGYVICVRRPPRGPLVLPAWMRPVTVASSAQPRTHEQLGEIYRSSRAFIAYERTTAIYEALICGCPVFCVSSDRFNERSFQRRFEGEGLCWSSDERALDRAAARVGRFAELYAALEADFPRRVEEVFVELLRSIRETSIR